MRCVWETRSTVFCVFYVLYLFSVSCSMPVGCPLLRAVVSTFSAFKNCIVPASRRWRGKLLGAITDDLFLPSLIHCALGLLTYDCILKVMRSIVLRELQRLHVARFQMAAYLPDWTLPYRTDHDVSNAISEYQKQIEELNVRITMLRARHNSLLPIGRLPPEVLGEIFVTLMQGYARDRTRDVGDYNPLRARPANNVYRWLVILRVCRQWKEIAMSYPRIWSYI